MDPITLVVTALALGASAGLKDTATEVVKDAYAALKTLIGKRRVDVSQLESRPESPNRQGTVREDLESLEGTPDRIDDAVIDAARRVLQAVKESDPAAGDLIGIDLEEFSAKSLRVSGLTTTGGAIRGRRWEIDGDAVFENIRAGGQREVSGGNPSDDPADPQ